MASPIKGSGYTFTVTLYAQSDGQALDNPTITASDVSISTDGGAVASLATTPTVNPAGSGIVQVDLTAAEVGDSRFVVGFEDVAGDEWKPLVYHETVSDPTTTGLALESTSQSILTTGGQGPWTTGTGGDPMLLPTSGLMTVEIVSTEHEVNLI